jgi:26S proteasome regulatory subunit N2
LGEFDESVKFALGAGKLFDVEAADRSSFVDTIMSKCLDMYTSLRMKEYEQQHGSSVDISSKPVQMDAKLQAVVERIFKRCFDDKEFKQVIGLALESRRLDVVEAAIKQGDAADLLHYTLNVAMTLVQNLTFRNQVCFRMTLNCP